MPNPYHDPRNGRFTNKPGAGASVGGALRRLTASSDYRSGKGTQRDGNTVSKTRGSTISADVRRRGNVARNVSADEAMRGTPRAYDGGGMLTARSGNRRSMSFSPNSPRGGGPRGRIGKTAGDNYENMLQTARRAGRESEKGERVTAADRRRERQAKYLQAEIDTAKKDGSFNSLRSLVAKYAGEGRATYIPAGARNNATAEVLVDGIRVGQASSLMAYVNEVSNGSKFGERSLVPKPDYKPKSAPAAKAGRSSVPSIDADRPARGSGLPGLAERAKLTKNERAYRDAVSAARRVSVTGYADGTGPKPVGRDAEVSAPTRFPGQAEYSRLTPDERRNMNDQMAKRRIAVTGYADNTGPGPTNRKFGAEAEKPMTMDEYRASLKASAPRSAAYDAKVAAARKIPRPSRNHTWDGKKWTEVNAVPITFSAGMGAAKPTKRKK